MAPTRRTGGTGSKRSIIPRWNAIRRFCAAFLDGACGQDDDLRREVVSLLAAAAASQGILGHLQSRRCLAKPGRSRPTG